MTLDAAQIKKDFPILDDPNLHFVDSAASSQRPRAVTDAMSDFYATEYANVHRGVYDLAMKATNRYEQARSAVATFIGASSANEIVFTKNATEAINLVAWSWGKQNLNEGDRIVLTMLDHHANIVPWQMLSADIGFSIDWISSTEDGRLDLSDIDAKLDGAKAFAFTAMSNVTGAIAPVTELCEKARSLGVMTMIDACQFVPHYATDMAAWNADFVAFSSHKMLGPSGIGVLWGREDLLNSIPPFLGGGGMIANVTTDGFTSAELPAKFEAGTPPIAEAVGLHAAVDYLNTIGMNQISTHEDNMSEYFLSEVYPNLGEKVRIIGPTNTVDRGAVFSFDIDGVHAHDVSQILNDSGVAVRPGHHCAKPLMRHFDVDATARASFYVYNDESDIDALGEAITKAIDFFG